jgi:hypothetical protein
VTSQPSEVHVETEVETEPSDDLIDLLFEELHEKSFEEWSLRKLVAWAYAEGRKSVLESEEGFCNYDFHRSVPEVEAGRDECGACGLPMKEHPTIQVCPEP